MPDTDVCASVCVTSGPKQHFFGYYDKFPWNASGRYLLAHEVAFADRPPTADDTAVLGIVDLHASNRFEPLTETRAWCWQQGAMLQWWPGDPERKIVFNDRRDGRFVSVIMDIHSGAERILPRPVSAISRDGRQALSLNLSRLADERPGYGYAGLPDPYADCGVTDENGIDLLDLATGEARLIISLAQAAELDHVSTMDGVKHWFNHALVSPEDKRFIVLHRWRCTDATRGWHHYTRMLTANVDGSGIFLLNDHDMTSHFDWRDGTHVIAYARRFERGDHYFLFTDRSSEVELIGGAEFAALRDGHCGYSSDGSWILTDTYPGETKHRRLLLYHPGQDRLIDLGRFYSQPWLTECRCDLHPRWSRDGRRICFDSSHSGSRQIYVMDVSALVCGQ